MLKPLLLKKIWSSRIYNVLKIQGTFLMNFLICIVGLEIHAQGNNCDFPLDITVNVPVNGFYEFEVDNSTGKKFFKYNVSQIGTLEMSSCLSGGFDTYLLVYKEDCTNLIYEEDNSGCFGGTEFIQEVQPGETYIFEWDDRHHNAASPLIFSPRLYFHEPVQGTTCNEAITVNNGLNNSNNWFGNQYFTYTTSDLGILTIDTCGLRDDSFIKIYEVCNGMLLIDSWSFTCPNDPEGDNGSAYITYEVDQPGKTLIIEIGTHGTYTEDDFQFNFQFNQNSNDGLSCDSAIEFSTPGVYEVDNSNGNQWFVFKAPKSGAGVITTGRSATRVGSYYLAGQQDTYVKVYDACSGSLIAQSDDFSGIHYASRVNIDFVEGQEYYILWDSQFTNGQYDFELFYWDDIISLTGSETNLREINTDEEIVYSAYVNQNNWFIFRFLEDGTFTTQPNYIPEAMNFTVINDPGVIHFENDPDEYGDDGFMYTGTAGETLVFYTTDYTAYNYQISTIFESTNCVTFQEVEEGTYQIDNSTANYYIRYHASSTGNVMISTCHSGNDSQINRYDSFCGTVLQSNDDASGCDNGGSTLIFEVTEGEYYYLEFTNQKTNSIYDVDIIMKEETPGYTISNPIAITTTEAMVADNSYFQNRYYRYDATEDGILEIGLCTAENVGALWQINEAGNMINPDNQISCGDEKNKVIITDIEVGQRYWFRFFNENDLEIPIAINFTPNTLSIIDNDLSSTIQLLTNPVKEAIKIRINKGIDEPLNITVSNLKGQILYTDSKIVTSPTTIDIPFELNTSGLYFLKVTVAQSSKTYKLIKT